MHPATERQSRPRVIICGGRDFVDHKRFEQRMDAFMANHGRPTIVIQGGALGADHMARLWAGMMGIQHIEVSANWSKEGRSAGPKRNQLMLDLLEPDFVVAFPGGAGTRDMVERATAAGVFIFEG
jgi:hypothetical protein